MKDKILNLIIGILIGAIITTVGFLVYNKIVASNQDDQFEMNENGGERELSGEPGDNGEEPPEMPDGENGDDSLEMPDDDGSEPSDGIEDSDENTTI